MQRVADLHILMMKTTICIAVLCICFAATRYEARPHKFADPGGFFAGDRAQAAWQALEFWFGYAGQDYPNIFSAALPGPHGEVQPNFVWQQGQMVRAALNLGQITGDYGGFFRTAPTLSRYLLTTNGTTGFAPPVDPGSRSPLPARWWDDNGHTALVLLKAYALLGDSSYLQTVRNLWPFFKTGVFPGGGQRENETSDFDEISTVAGSSSDEVAERLYLLTNSSDPHHADYLNFALANDAATKAKLRAPNGLYWGGYYPDIQQSGFKWCNGTLDKTTNVCTGTWWACNPVRPDLPTPQIPSTPNVCAWSFPANQGYMISSDVLLYRITGNQSYLQSATLTANAALALFTPDWIWKLTPWDNAVFFTGLLDLAHYTNDPRIRATLDAYLDRVWNEGRDPWTGLFNRGGIGMADPTTGPTSMDQASFVRLFSMQAWPDSSQDHF